MKNKNIIEKGTICTSDCVTCSYCTLDESNKAKVKIICGNKNKEYYYGQMIFCEDYDERKE